MNELLFSSKVTQEIIQIITLLKTSNINCFIKLCSKIPMNNNFKYSIYNNEFESDIILNEQIENFCEHLSENEYFEIYVDKNDLLIASKIINKNCVFSSTDSEKVNIVKNLLEHYGHKIKETVETKNEFNEIEYSIFVDDEYYDIATNLIEKNIENAAKSDTNGFKIGKYYFNNWFKKMTGESKIIYTVLYTIVILSFIAIYIIVKK
jgi:hypothetical protein